MSKFSPPLVLVLATSVLLAACDGQGGQSDWTGPAELRSTATFGQVTLDWTPAKPATVLYSSDPDCNWDTYSTCADSGMLLNQSPGVSLGLADGLELDQNYAFVVETDSGRSEPKMAAPWAPGIPFGAQSTLVHDGVWYIGGQFNRVAPATGNAAIFDPDSGAMVGPLQQVSGNVRVVVAAEGGGWYIGGEFTWIGDESQRSLARIRADGSFDRNWRPNLNGRVEALLIDHGVLYVGGRFGTVDGIPREGLAAFDLDTDELTDWGPAVSRTQGVRSFTSLASVGDRVVFGGRFDDVDGQARQNLAAVKKDGEVASFNPQLRWDDGEGFVNTLEAAGNRLFVGGRFDQAEGDTVGHLVAYDMETGDLEDWAPLMNSVVSDLAVSGDSLYTTGSFSEITQRGTLYSRASVAAFDLDTGDLDAWSPDVAGPPGTTVQVEDSRIYVGGSFTLEHADRVYRNLIALDRATGALLPWAVTTGGPVQAMAQSNGRLYVGGDFETASGVDRQGLAAFDVQNGTLLDWAPRLSAQVNAHVRALQADADRLYVGGTFNSVNDETRRSLAAFSLASGELDDWQPEVRAAFGSVDAQVHTLLLAGDTLYLGGQFSKVDGEERQSLAAVSTTGAGNHWVTNWAPQLDTGAIVYDLALHQGELLIGGEFDELNDEPQHNLALLDTQTGDVARDWDPAPVSRVEAVLSMGDQLFAGTASSNGYGAYPNLDTVVAQFAGSPLDLVADWDLFHDQYDAADTLAGNDNRVLVGVSPWGLGGRISSFLSHEPDEEDWVTHVNRPVRDLVYHDGRVYTVGNFDRIDGQYRPGMAVLDAQTGELVR